MLPKTIISLYSQSISHAIETKVKFVTRVGEWCSNFITRLLTATNLVRFPHEIQI